MSKKYCHRYKNYCLVCKKKTDNKDIGGLALENKIGQKKSTDVDCDFKKTIFLKPIKPIKKQKIIFADYKNMFYGSNCKKYTDEACPKKTNQDNKYQNQRNIKMCWLFGS